MLQEQSKFKGAPLSTLLVMGLLWRSCDAQMKKKESPPPDGDGGGVGGAGGGDSGAFFALRSCHQLLQGDGGEFFSPDYLCSNPPLWCNWTIRANPGMRLHLQLEDLTPDQTCHLKQDQIHVDEPAVRDAAHRVLQKCWREAKFTSSSNTLYVVLLIGGQPASTYRGFYARYHAFGPLVLYHPGEGLTGSDLGPSDHVTDSREPERSNVMYDDYELDEEEAEGEVGENLRPSWQSYRPLHPFTASTGSSRIIGSGRGVAAKRSHSPVHPVSPQQPLYQLNSSTLTPTAARGARNQGDYTGVQIDQGDHAGNLSQLDTHAVNDSQQDHSSDPSMDRGEDSNRPPPPSEESGSQTTEPTHRHPSLVEPLSDHRARLNMRNHSGTPHIPGDHLFEVAVEVNFRLDLDQSWDSSARSLLQGVKSLISSQLGALHMLPSLSSKRIKRLHAGALYILWLQIGQKPGHVRVHGAVHSALQGLVSAGAVLVENQSNAVVMSVSTADVNECGTQLVLCDVNADCVNQFGSYSCRCKPGFQDQSRLGSGGTICVELKAEGCGSGLSSEAKGVYVLFFLLSFLILMLLAATAMFYHRHRRGAFLVRCHSSGSLSPQDPNNNQHPLEGPCDLPPPPPPARAHREGWPPVKERRPAADLPLLRFSPLLPPDGYVDPHMGGKL